MERSHACRIKLVHKIRIVWTYNPNTWKVKSIRYKWVFVQMCNKKNDIIRYQAWLIV